MKKNILLLFLIFVSISSMFPSALGSTFQIYEDIKHTQKEIENNTIPSRGEMKLIISDLDEKTNLDQFYQENKLPVIWPALKNLVLGFGTGTKDQGKIVTSTIYQAIDTTIIAGGLSIALLAFFNDTFWASVSSTNVEALAPQVLMYTAIAEIAMHSIEFIYALIYGSSYNVMMKNKLKLIAKIKPINNEVTIATKITLS